MTRVAACASVGDRAGGVTGGASCIAIVCVKVSFPRPRVAAFEKSEKWSEERRKRGKNKEKNMCGGGRSVGSGGGGGGVSVWWVYHFMWACFPNVFFNGFVRVARRWSCGSC